MARYLLDSNVVIDYLFGVPAAVALLEGLDRTGETLCICDVVVTEVYSGLRPNHEGRATRLFSGCAFLSTTYGAAAQAGRWRSSYRAAGRVLATTDALVAATAHEHGAAVITADAALIGMREIETLPLPRGTDS